MHHHPLRPLPPGYSYQVTQKHATAAAEPWSRYPKINPTRIMTNVVLCNGASK